MTARELSERYGYSESTIITNFNRTAATIRRKYGDIIVKQFGVDNYTICNDDNRSRYFFEQKTEVKKGIHLRREILSLDDFTFLILLGILCTPCQYFRGTALQLLDYLRIDKYSKLKKQGQKSIDKILKELKQKKYITVQYQKNSKGQKDYFIKSYVATEDGDAWFAFDVGKICYEIIQEKNLNIIKLPQLIKVWIAMENQQHEKPFNYYHLKKMTELSNHQIRDAYKLLKEKGSLLGVKKHQTYFIFSFDSYMENDLVNR